MKETDLIRNLKNLPVGVFRIDSQGIIVSANLACAHLLGFCDESELAGIRITDLCREESRREDINNTLSRRHSVLEQEILLQRRDQSQFWAVIHLIPVDLRSDQPVFFDAVLTDMTRHRQLEDALVQGKKEWERSFDAVREMVVLTDSQLNIVRLNRAFAEQIGAHPKELVKQSLLEVLFGDNPSPIADILRESAQLPEEFELTGTRLRGEWHFSVTPRVDERGLNNGSIFVGRDVTSQRQAEEILHRQVLVEQAEQIFMTFRHEIGNTINTLKTTLQVLHENIEKFSIEKREEYFERSFDGMAIAEHLLRALKSYQALDEVQLHRLDLGRFFSNKSGLFFESARILGIQCEIEVSEETIEVFIDQTALTRIMLNLVENAIAAMKETINPLITIKVYRRQVWAIVEVIDNGPGIPVENRDKVFAPLYTTKESGSGMGLAIVQKLMVKMDGLSALGDDADAGCRIELRFPSKPVKPV